MSFKVDDLDFLMQIMPHYLEHPLVVDQLANVKISTKNLTSNHYNWAFVHTKKSCSAGKRYDWADTDADEIVVEISNMLNRFTLAVAA